MKKLCVLIALMVMSVGAWADDYYLSSDTWFSNVQEKTQNVLKISLCKDGGGALQSAIDAITADGWTLNGKSLSDFREVYIDMGKNNGQLIDAYAMNDDDIAALSNLNFETIDLQDAYYKKDGEKSAFTFTNSYVQNLILPDNWSKEEVNNCTKSVGSNLGAAISQCPIDENSATVYAYVCKPGTLVNTTQHVFFDGKENSKVGALNQYSQSFNKVKSLVISGYGAARDFGGVYGGLEYDANGHLIFDKPADETTDTRNAAVGGGTRALIGGAEKLEGAWYGAVLETLDLESLILEDEYNDDLNLSYCGLVGGSTKVVKIPTYSGFHTIPADFLNTNSNSVSQICIPGNITKIKTRAFAVAPLNHVWTTVGSDGPTVVDEEGNDATVYDNGVMLTNAEELAYGYQDISSPTDILYGTYTLPAGLELIESRAFANTQPRIKDVYVLSVKAPECHVDAFSTGAYTANNSLEGKPVDGIITRDAYAKTAAAGTWVTMLHYPRESTTPDIQRYTDVTRDYSIATGLRDGKGATIYFPTQNEFNRAYFQGTFGYLWQAWDPTRDDNNSVANPGLGMTEGYSQTGQQTANQAYLDNNAAGVDKTDRSFYDVTDLNNLDQPDGLKYYYETVWEGKQLYPEIETVGTGTYRTVNVYDENGNLCYVVDNETPGTFHKVGNYVADNEGNFVQELTATENNAGAYVKDYNYEEAEGTSGEYCLPFISYGETIWGSFADPGNDKIYYNREAEYTLDNENGKWFQNPYNNNQWTSIDDASWWEGDLYSVSYTYNIWDHSTYPADLYYKSETYETYDASKGDVTTYNKVYSNTYREYNSSTDEGETRYEVTFGDFREYVADTDADLQRYSVSYTYLEDVSSLSTEKTVNPYIDDSENLYAVETKEVEILSVADSKDYRGWHQFVLTSYAANSTVPFVPYRSYISDNDWWTICLPFDLTRAELIKLFGTEDGNKIPYLSKLTYVVRDVENRDITLNFSKNLLEYKEELVGDSKLHGKVSEEAGGVNDDDIVLHKGVPYLIRPNLTAEANGSFKRQFDIMSTGVEGDLYDRIQTSQELAGSEMNQIIYDGEYTVPAYVINNSESVESVYEGESVSFNMGDNTTFDYANNTTITYNKEEVDAQISSDYSYTFVGSFFLSLMPQYSYFLGWDSAKKKAAFWYNAVPDKNNWTWNNETGIILPNFTANGQEITITAAKDLDNPARWVINLDKGDDFPETSSAKNHVTAMNFGGSAKMFDGDATVIIKVDNDVIDPSTIHFNNKGVYSISGQYLGTSLEGLQKGVYVKDGKKIILK